VVEVVVDVVVVELAMVVVDWTVVEVAGCEAELSRSSSSGKAVATETPTKAKNTTAESTITIFAFCEADKVFGDDEISLILLILNPAQNRNCHKTSPNLQLATHNHRSSEIRNSPVGAHLLGYLLE